MDKSQFESDYDEYYTLSEVRLMMDTLHIRILNSLSTDQFISSQEIALEVGKSDKTVRAKIKDLNEILAHNGAHIITKMGLGYQLVVNNERQFHEFMKKYNGSNDSSQNLRKLIHCFLGTSEYLKADDLAEMLYVSKSTLTKYLNEFRVYLRQYDLEIESRPHYGLKILGSEFNLRRFIASNFAQDYSQDYDEVQNDGSFDYSEYTALHTLVSQIVIKEVEDYGINMSDAVLQSVISHISIAILRIRTNSLIELSSELSVIDGNDRHYRMVQSIMKKISKRLDVNFPDQEIAYISMHFMSKKVIGRDQIDKIPQEINALIDTILLKISVERHVDLSNDLDLRTMLGLHIVPLIHRLRFGTYLKNPILDDVKLACIAGYDLAIIASEVIEDYVGETLHDHEISYLAMHFDVALNQNREQIYLKNILVVCSSGRASGQLLKHRFYQHFSQYIKQIDVCDIHEIDAFEQEMHYDYIFTTVPLDRKTNAPMFEFEFFLNQESVHAIETILTRKSGAMHVMDVFKESMFFVNEAPLTKEAVLNDLITRITQHAKLPKNFRALVWERERFSTTDVLPHIAIPHPNRLVSDDSFVACMVLDKPINWGNHEVSILFLPCLSKEDSEKYAFIYDWIIKLSNSKETILNIQNNKTYESLVNGVLKITNDKERNL